MRSLPMITTVCVGFLASITSGLGINCRGSMRCIPQDDDTVYHLSNYLWDIGGENLTRIYRDGELIACHSAVCAFLQRTGRGLPGSEIVKLANHLWDHKCEKCGSVPIHYPKSNNCNDGMLTFNYIYGCNDCVYDDSRGLCPPNTGGKQGGKWTWKCQNKHEPWKWHGGKPPPSVVNAPPQEKPPAGEVPADEEVPEEEAPAREEEEEEKEEEEGEISARALNLNKRVGFSKRRVSLKKKSGHQRALEVTNYYTHG